MPFTEITELQVAIRATHGCESWWEASVKVDEQLQGRLLHVGHNPTCKSGCLLRGRFDKTK